MLYKEHPIASAYKAQTRQIRPFYAQQLEPDWSTLSDQVLARYPGRAVLRELIAQNHDVDTVKAREYLHWLQNENTLLVVTGQQMGLLVSPLYTVYKALTAIRLADKLNKRMTGRRFVPVFWLESEDHDFDEINHTHYRDASGNICTVGLPEGSGQTGRSIQKRELPPEISGILATLENDLQPSEFKQHVIEFLRKVYRPGVSWTSAFREHLQELLGRFGLLCFNPGAEGVKKLSVPFFEQMIEKNDQVVQTFFRQAGALAELGLSPQVPVQEERSYLFMSYKDGRRMHLFRENNNRFFQKNTTHSWTKAELLKLLHQHPEWFSSSVLSRPLWQSWMLPVVSYVAGPAEIAYWGQLRPAFEMLGLAMPHLQPRATFTLIEPAVRRLMTRYDIRPQAIAPRLADFQGQYFKASSLSHIDDLFSGLATNLEQTRIDLCDELKQVDPTLCAPVDKTFSSMSNNLEKLLNRIIQRSKEKDQLTAGQLQKVHEAFLPKGHLQERFLGSVYFNNKFGTGWLDKVFDAIELEDHTHKFIEL